MNRSALILALLAVEASLAVVDVENSAHEAGRLRRAAAGSVGGSVISVETYDVAHELRPAGAGT